MINQFYIDYIKAIENPDRIGWNGKVWIAPQYEGYDKNQRGYGIDIVRNDSAKRLTQNRPGQWLTEGEADRLMKEHILYVYNAAQKHIKGFDNLSDERKAALIGMLYRGDSVNKNRHIINIDEPDDNKFFESISNYYKSKGLNERAKNSSKFFNNQLQTTKFLIPMKWELWEPPMKFKDGGQIRKMQTAAGGPITRYETLPNIEVVGYRPIELKTYKPLHKDYPFTGHSSLDIPIDEDSAYTQGWYSPYGISVDKTANSKDYNLVTNNCADATLGALNYIFGTKEKPLLFTTPGDVRDYAINKLHGKVTRDKDGIDTILIPRNKNNAKKISKKALEWAKNKDENTIYEFEYKQGGKMNILEFLKKGGQIRKMLTAAGGPIKRPRIKLNGLWRELNYEGNGDFSTLTENGKRSFTTGQKSPKSIVGNKEIVVTPEQTTVLDKLDNTKNYYSAYNPDDIIKGFNALTLGGLNNLSPTLWARRYYDLNKLLGSLIPGSKRAMTWSGFVNNWLNGNNGLVSEKFAQKHPYWSMGINGVGDAVALGGMANASKINLVGNIATKHGRHAAKIAIDVAKNSSKPFNWRNYKFLGDSRFYSDLDNAGYKTIMTERLFGNYPLTFTERRNYVSGLKDDIQKGVDYAINEAKTNVKTPLRLGKEVEYTFNGGRGWRLDPYSPEDILPLKIHYGTLKTTRAYGKTPWEGDYGAFQSEKGLFFPFRDEPNTLRTHSMFLDAGERISTGAHETRHTIQSYFDVPLTEIRYDMPGTYGRYTNRELPLDFKKKINEFINDALTAGEWQGSLSEMDSELTGWSAKYGFPRYSQMNPQQKALLHDLFLGRFGGVSDYKNYGEISSLLRLNPDYNTSLLYSKILDDSKIGQIIQGLEELGYRKQGGMLQLLKNGSGIHIKKKNRGKFTSYCGGKVTNECIRKAKASGNPTLVKRATFAANARKWKHKKGGKAFVKGVNILDSNSKAYKYVKKAQQGGNINWGQLISGVASSALSTYALNQLLKALKELEVSELKGTFEEMRNLLVSDALEKLNQLRELWKLDYLNGTTLDRSFESNAVYLSLKNNLTNNAITEAKNKYENLKKGIDAKYKSLMSNNWMNFGTNLMLTGMGIAGLYLSNKGTTNAAPSTTPTTTGSSIYKLDSFWEKPYLTPNTTSIM